VLEENAAMSEPPRIRLYWDDGTVETAHQPIEAGVTLIVRDRLHRLEAPTR
jgi:hypothetical protein